MADEQLHFGVSLEDHMSGPAKAAAKTLKELESALSATRKQLTLANQLGDIAGHKKYASLLEEQKRGVFGLRQALEGMPKPPDEHKSFWKELAGDFVKVVEPAEVLKDAFSEAGAGFKEFASAIMAGEAQGAIQGITEVTAGLAQMLDLVVPGLGQVASAAIKAGGAILGSTVGAMQSLIEKGVELSIEATHTKAALIDSFAALGGGAEAGRQTEEMLAGLSHQIGITRETLVPFTKSFMAMGIEGEESLKKVTTAAISAQAIMGDPSAAQAFENLTKKIQVAAQTGQGLKIPAKGLGSLAEMGILVDDVAKRMNVSSHALSMQLKAGTVDAKKFGEALQDALIEKGAKPLQRMGSSFENMKKMFGQSIEEMFEDMGPAVEPFLEQLRGALDLFSQNTESGRVMKSAVTGAFTSIFHAATKAVVPVEHLFLRTMILSVKAYTLVKKYATELKAVGQIASNFVQGISMGIAGGGPGLLAAGQLAGNAAKTGVNLALENKSPSKAGFRAGGFLTAGVAMGIRSGTPAVSSAARNSGGATLRGIVGGLRMPAPAAARGGGMGGGVQGPITINLQAPNGVTHAMELTEIGVAALFERLALGTGR